MESLTRRPCLRSDYRGELINGQQEGDPVTSTGTEMVSLVVLQPGLLTIYFTFWGGGRPEVYVSSTSLPHVWIATSTDMIVSRRVRAACGPDFCELTSSF